MTIRKKFVLYDLSSIVTIITIVVTLLGSFYSMKSSIEQSIAEIRQIQKDNQLYKQQLDSIKIQYIEDSQEIKNIRIDIKEMKEDIKLLSRKVR